MYEDVYEEKFGDYSDLQDEYNELKQRRKKILNSYSRFFQKMYAMYKSKESLDPKEITKLIRDDWSTLPIEEKEVYQN